MAIAAVEFSDRSSMLGKYRVWAGSSQTSTAELFDFMTVPSNNRQAFLSTLDRDVRPVSKLYVRQIYR